MKSWRDIAMDCLTHVSKVRAAKVPKSAFGHANRRQASPLRVETPAGRYEERLRPASYFRPAQAQLNDGLRNGAVVRFPSLPMAAIGATGHSPFVRDCRSSV